MQIPNDDRILHQYKSQQLRYNQLKDDFATCSLSGTIVKIDRFWVASIELVDVSTQGITKRETIWMLEDAIRTESNLPYLRLQTKELAEGKLVVTIYDTKFDVWLLNRILKTKEKKC